MSQLSFDTLMAVVMDMDGTLWRGEEPLPGLGAWFQFLAGKRVPFILATNNAFWPPEHYVPKLAGFGVTISPAAVLTSAIAAAEWLRVRRPDGGRVHVVGGDALWAALANAGFEMVGPDAAVADAVVAGIDFDLTYAKLRDASRLIRAGAWFVGTNPDATYPTEHGLAPGAGTVLAALQTASGVAPTIVGKPERPMFDIALARLGTPPEHTLMVGDRLDTDILGGRRAGLQTAFVTSGVDGSEDVAARGIMPDGIFDGLDALRVAWETALGDGVGPDGRRVACAASGAR